jgi:hypothetical protein
VSPEKLPSMLGGAAVAQVYARAPLGAAQTQVVRIPAYRLPDDVVAGMLNAAVSRDRERADYTLLSRELTGTDPNDMRLRRAYDDAATVAGAEATAYRENCSCVFAAVVRGAPAARDQIAERTQVRTRRPRCAPWTAPSSGRRYPSSTPLCPWRHARQPRRHRAVGRLLPPKPSRRYPRRLGPL